MNKKALRLKIDYNYKNVSYKTRNTYTVSRIIYRYCKINNIKGKIIVVDVLPDTIKIMDKHNNLYILKGYQLEKTKCCDCKFYSKIEIFKHYYYHYYCESLQEKIYRNRPYCERFMEKMRPSRFYCKKLL